MHGSWQVCITWKRFRPKILLELVTRTSIRFFRAQKKVISIRVSSLFFLQLYLLKTIKQAVSRNSERNYYGTSPRSYYNAFIVCYLSFSDVLQWSYTYTEHSSRALSSICIVICSKANSARINRVRVKGAITFHITYITMFRLEQAWSQLYI